MPKFIWLLCIGLAGGAGALARYGLAKFVQDSTKGLFPWGTFTVNVAGCLVFGLLFVVMTDRFNVNPHVRAVVLVGFMGAFTTFSTFAFETGEFLRDGQWLLAVGNVAGQNLFGLAALFAGLSLGKLF